MQSNTTHSTSNCQKGDHSITLMYVNGRTSRPEHENTKSVLGRLSVHCDLHRWVQDNRDPNVNKSLLWEHLNSVWAPFSLILLPQYHDRISLFKSQSFHGFDNSSWHLHLNILSPFSWQTNPTLNLIVVETVILTSQGNEILHFKQHGAKPAAGTF